MPKSARMSPLREAQQRRSATLVLYLLLQLSIFFKGDQFACSTIEGKQQAIGDGGPMQVVNGKTGNAGHEKEKKKEDILLLTVVAG